MNNRLREIVLLLIAAAVFMLPSTGCTPASDGTFELLDTQLASLKLDDLGRTMDFVRSEKRFDQDEFIDKVALGMNRWARSDDEIFDGDGWELDPLVSSLVAEFGEEPSAQGVADVSFSNTDPFFLQQSGWVEWVADRLTGSQNLRAYELYQLAAGDFVPAEDSKDQLADIFAELHSDLELEDAAKLANGFRAFDWIIRNIQLEKMDDNDEELDGGPGYKRMPWQVLLYSRGDYIERGKLFMLVASQMGIDNVMLATGDNETPWCVALAIGGKLYLFDTKLGLPIPAGQPGQIATLGEARSDATILDSLDLTVEESLDDDNEYWVKKDDLGELTGLIYTSPEFVSRRMAAAQKRLKGEHLIQVYSRPSDVAERLPNIDGFKTSVWDIEFKCHEFRRKLREAIAKSSFDNVAADKIRWQFGEEGYIDSFSVYRTARSRYFSGRFAAEKRWRTAIESFYLLMYSDEKINSLATDVFLQQQLGIRKQKGQAAAEFQQHLASIQAQMRLVRRDTGYFLAHCHFDNGNIGTAANWLERLLDKPDAERWRTGIEYLLGRSLESRREYDRALELYSKKDSTQLHGNLIRSRMLKSLIKDLSVSTDSAQ